MKLFQLYPFSVNLLVCLFAVMTLSLSCKQKVLPKSESLAQKTQDQALPSLKIQYPTGSLLPQSIMKSKVPTFFNVGTLGKDVYGVLLGPTVDTKKEYRYEPLGVYTITKDSTQLSFILCKSDQIESDFINADNYNSWSLNEIQYKNLISAWFKTNCELNSCSKMEWANDLKALRILESIN